MAAATVSRHGRGACGRSGGALGASWRSRARRRSRCTCRGRRRARRRGLGDSRGWSTLGDSRRWAAGRHRRRRACLPIRPRGTAEERRRLAVVGDRMSSQDVGDRVESDDDREREQSGEDGQSPARTPSAGVGRLRRPRIHDGGDFGGSLAALARAPLLGGRLRLGTGRPVRADAGGVLHTGRVARRRDRAVSNHRQRLHRRNLLRGLGHRLPWTAQELGDERHEHRRDRRADERPRTPNP